MATPDLRANHENLKIALNVLTKSDRNRYTSPGMHGLIRAQAIGAAAAILFTRSVAADDWPYYQHDAQHTGNSSAIVDPQSLSLAWTAPSFFTGGYSTPVIVGNTIYAMQNQQGYSGGGLRTRVTSFNLSTGAINWTYSGSFVFPSQPGVGGGFVTFVGSTFSSTSLYVLDAATGTLRYTVPIFAGMGSVMPTVVRDPVTGHVTAFVTDGGGYLNAVSLGLTSGSVLWTRSGQFGGFSIPTVVGNSIVLAGPGQYYAFNQATGAANHFWSGNIYGGGGSTVAYDATRQQFYVVEAYNDPTATLSAYHYTDNAHIRLLWQRTGEGVGSQAVIGPTGRVYSAGNSVIWELDPVTGTTLRSIPGSFAGTPSITNNVLWILGESQTFAFDLVTLQLLGAVNGGGSNPPYRSPGAFANGYFVVDYGNVVGSPSFDVYSSPLPGAATNPATNVASFSATLDGSVNARGSTTTVDFEYGLTTSYGSATVMETKTGHTPRAISANITGLLPSHPYHFRIVAHNIHGTTFGGDRTFTTLSATGRPAVKTNPATLVASFSATLNALLDPHGLTTSVHFQYGPTTSYGLTTAPRNETGNTYRKVSANISSLTASTTYHFRIVASNADGTRIGSDKTFTTFTATGPPVVTTNSASNVTTSSAKLNGLLDPHGLTTTVNFQYGTTISYGHATAMQSQTGNTYRTIAANISGLTTRTTYHFRIVGTNNGGTRAGSDRTFTTP